MLLILVSLNNKNSACFPEQKCLHWSSKTQPHRPMHWEGVLPTTALGNRRMDFRNFVAPAGDWELILTPLGCGLGGPAEH